MFVPPAVLWRALGVLVGFIGVVVIGGLVVLLIAFWNGHSEQWRRVGPIG